MRKLSIDSLVAAAWNYKSAGTPDQIERLKNSIMHDSSAGVLCVRRLPNGKYEVIDGNHRLTAIQQLGIAEVWVEDFGDITLAQAVAISYRRNEQWFETDSIQLSKIMRDSVLPEIGTEVLESIAPLNKHELESLLNLAHFDWSKLPEQPKSLKPENIKFSFVTAPESQAYVMLWERVAHKAFGVSGRSSAIEFAVMLALTHAPEYLRAIEKIKKSDQAKERKRQSENVWKAATLFASKNVKRPASEE